MSDMTPEHQAFKEKYELFMAETQLSCAAAAKVLDVSAGSLKEWYRERGGRVRKPALHIMRSVELKIDRLNQANEANGIYNALFGMAPRDRVTYLREKLSNHHLATA